MASLTQCRHAFQSLFAEDVAPFLPSLPDSEKILALDIEQLRSAVQLCRKYDESQNEGVEVECEQNLYALPEAFFAEGVVDGDGLERAAAAMRRVIDVGMCGQGLARATREFLHLLLRADAEADETHPPSPEWRSGYGRLFIAMCTAAKANGRVDEITTALPRARLLHDALMASKEAVQGLRLLGIRIDADTAEAMALRAKLKSGMKELAEDAEAAGSDVDCYDQLRFDLEYGPLKDAVARLDAWHFSEQLASAFYDFSLGLGLDEMSARLVTHFAEAEPGPLKSNQSQKRLTSRLFALLLRAQDRRQLSMTEPLSISAH